MIPVWTFIKGAFTFLVKNWGWIATVSMLLFIFLFFQQCGATRSAKAETEQAKLIADNNLKAMKDSTIILKMTREQLAMTDKNLSKVTRDLDSMKQHPKVVYVIKPIYVPKDVTTSNELVRDPKDSTKYGLKFLSIDSVRTIGATSWFNATETETKVAITPRETIIDKFDFNFGLAISRYDDKKEKVTRLSVIPYHLDANGDFTKPISKQLLDMQYRGVELLEVPYKENPCPENAPPKHKYSLRSGFSLSINLLSVGYSPFTTPAAFNWAMPSLGVGYSFVLVRNK